MSKTRKQRVKPLPPLMVQAFANLRQALDMSVPANLDRSYPFFIKGVDDRQPCDKNSACKRVQTAQEGGKEAEGMELVLSPPKTARRLTTGELGRMRAEIQALVEKTPRGAAGVADLLGVNASSLRHFLLASYDSYRANIIAAWQAFNGSPTCKTCGQDIKEAVPA